MSPKKAYKLINRNNVIWITRIASFIGCLFLLLTYPSFLDTYAQTSCQTNPSLPRADGLISAQNIGGKFGNVEGNCVTDRAAIIPINQGKIKVDTYDDLFALFYTQNRNPGIQKIEGTIPTQGNSFRVHGKKLYHNVGNLTINKDIAAAGTDTVVLVFVKGDLYINNNISYADADSSSGIVFIVKGGIYINPSVTSINAVLISEGILCTRYDVTASPPQDLCPNNTSNNDSILTVKGSLISIAQDPTARIKFTRALPDNEQAAERINAQAKYLVILKELFAKTLAIQFEDADFDINENISYSTPYQAPYGTPYATPPSPSPSPIPSPSPSPSPPTISGSPASMNAGDNVNITFSNVPSPTTMDWIGLYQVGAADTAYVNWVYSSYCPGSGSVARSSGGCTLSTLNIPSGGNYELRLFANNGYTRIAKSNSFTINPVVTGIRSSTISWNVPAFSGSIYSGVYTIPEPGAIIGIHQVNTVAWDCLTFGIAKTSSGNPANAGQVPPGGDGPWGINMASRSQFFRLQANSCAGYNVTPGNVQFKVYYIAAEPSVNSLIKSYGFSWNVPSYATSIYSSIYTLPEPGAVIGILETVAPPVWDCLTFATAKDASAISRGVGQVPPASDGPWGINMGSRTQFFRLQANSCAGYNVTPGVAQFKAYYLTDTSPPPSTGITSTTISWDPPSFNGVTYSSIFSIPQAGAIIGIQSLNSNGWDCLTFGLAAQSSDKTRGVGQVPPATDGPWGINMYTRNQFFRLQANSCAGYNVDPGNMQFKVYYIPDGATIP